MLFWNKKKIVTDTYSQYGIPGHNFITNGCRIKVVIDPPKTYFSKELKKDTRNYDKLLLIHGCETPDINEIKQEVIIHSTSFDKICSFDREVVDQCTNAEFFCFGSCWVLTDKNGKQVGMKDEYVNCFEPKSQFEVSFIHSNKRELPGHQLRYSILPLLAKEYKFRLNFPKERVETKIALFKNAMFHITIENSRYDNYITEKVIDCFMSYTIPIYWGCPNISEHFDKNGIISFNTKEELKEILDKLSPEDYLTRMEAVKRNYEIAKEGYAFFFDKINYFISKL
ncbi:MAG: glycosyltransferase family 10 domain-containing protein [Bacteroidia bacterium]